MALLLTQEEADTLLAMEKSFYGSETFIFPGLGGSINIPLLSTDHRESFNFDISVGRIALTKRTFQNRVRKTLILARLDMGGSPHRNPDGNVIECPHLHIYKEGFGTKWAHPIPDDFSDLNQLEQILFDFRKFCNITGDIPIEMELPYGNNAE